MEAFSLGMLLRAAATFVLGLGLFLASTVVFDCVHWTLHRFSASRIGGLRSIGSLHDAHQTFLDRELHHNDEQQQRNIRLHVIPELITQMCVSLVCLIFLPAGIVGTAMVLHWTSSRAVPRRAML
jgi:hypothetical protein